MNVIRVSQVPPIGLYPPPPSNGGIVPPWLEKPLPKPKVKS